MVPVLQTARKAFGRYLGGIKKATAPYGFDYRKELMLWNFTDEDTLKKWDCICDDEVGGKSNAQFEPNGKGTGAIFRGELSTAMPSDKSAKKGGYTAIRSRPVKEKWFDTGSMDVSEYDAFELCVRSDGRRFILNIGDPGIVRKDDVWQYFMFPRGGPEWENITVFFDDFFVTHKGYMQDEHFSFNRKNLCSFGILLADRTDGEFCLEIKHIKAVRRMLLHKSVLRF